MLVKDKNPCRGKGCRSKQVRRFERPPFTLVAGLFHAKIAIFCVPVMSVMSFMSFMSVMQTHHADLCHHAVRGLARGVTVDVDQVQPRDLVAVLVA